MDIFEAIKNNDINSVKYFIKNGTNVNVKNKYNDTPLLWASQFGHFKIVKYLVDNFADVNAKTNNNNTSLTLASYYGYLKTIKYLVKNGADVNAKNYWNDTPLKIASQFNYFKIVKYLIKGGADIRFTSDYESNIIHWLTQYLNKLYFYYLNQYFDKYTASTMFKF